MSKLRIAVCGPNQEDNEWLTNKIVDLISPFSKSFRLLENPLSELVREIQQVKWTSQIDETNLYSNVWRVLQQIKFDDSDVLISPNCGIDCVASQAAWLAQQAVALEQKGNLLGSDGKQIITIDHIMFNKSGATLQTILSQAEQEAVEFWNYIYAFLPSTSKLVQHTNDILAQYEDFLESAPAFAKVIRIEKETASEFLKQEVDKWQKHLDS